MQPRYGKYRGFVMDVEDPKQLGRVKARVPDVFGENETTDWAWPVLPYGGSSDLGFFFIPDMGSGVYIEFEGGNVNRPLWTGFWWAEKDGVNEIPIEAKENYPKRRIIKTSTGMYIMFDDETNLLRIFHPSETQIDMLENGDVEEKITRDLTVDIGGDRKENIGGSLTIEVEGDCYVHSGGNIIVDADGIISLNP